MAKQSGYYDATLKRLYDEQALPVDQLPYTDQIREMARTLYREYPGDFRDLHIISEPDGAYRQIERLVYGGLMRLRKSGKLQRKSLGEKAADVL